MLNQFFAGDSSALEGLITGTGAGLAVTVILGIAQWLRLYWSRWNDVKYIRDLLIQGKKRVIEAEDTHHSGMNSMMSEDNLRAAQYNLLMRHMEVALEKWTIHLSHSQRRDLLKALDWFHIDSLYGLPGHGTVEFYEPPAGRWPTKEMSIQHAEEKFQKLESVKWLKLKGKWD